MRIRFRILLACLSLASVTIALGLFVLQGQRELGRLALRIYDDAVMSISYARSAETRFVELRGKLAISNQAREAAAPRERASGRRCSRSRAGRAAPDPAANVGASAEGTLKDHMLARAEVDKAVATIVDDLDVAIERAMSDEGRKSGDLAGVRRGRCRRLARRHIDQADRGDHRRVRPAGRAIFGGRAATACQRGGSCGPGHPIHDQRHRRFGCHCDLHHLGAEHRDRPGGPEGRQICRGYRRRPTGRRDRSAQTPRKERDGCIACGPVAHAGGDPRKSRQVGTAARREDRIRAEPGASAQG